MEQIIITKPDTTTWALMTRSAVSSVTRGEQRKALLGEDVINMTVESAIPLSFDIGDTINIFGSTYILNALPKPLKAGKRKFSYDITWEGRQYDLLKPMYLDEGIDEISISPDFPLTGNLKFFLDVLINNANRIFGTGVWVLGDYPATDYRTLNFSNENCLAVLQRLCKQENFGKEFEIIENAGVCTINIKAAIGQDHATTYEYGKGKGLWDLTRETVSDKNIITRLYVFGANKNLASDYRGYSQRLKLPGNDLSYIEDPDVIDLYGLIEGVKIFDEIFPHRPGTVSSLGATVDEFYDTSMDFDLNAVDGGGNTLYLIAGTTAKIHFNTGNLAGYEFGILSYDHATKKFKIQTFKDERGLEFPNINSSAFQITAGDKYVIIDIRMPQTYINAAESALATAGNDYYALVSQPRVQYSQTFDELYFKQKYAGQSTVNVFGIGDNVHITDTDIGVDKTIRLRSFRRDIIRSYKYALDLYDYSEESIAQRLLNSSNETTKIISSNNLNGVSGSRHDDKYYTGAEINTALALKAPKASPTFTGTVVLPTTTSIGTVSAIEIGYLNGVTSALQTQLGLKAPLADPTFTGVVTLTGDRPVTIQSGNVRMRGNAGGWAMEYGFLGSGGTDFGGFGALGGADGLNTYYIGKYTDQKVFVTAAGNVGIASTANDAIINYGGLQKDNYVSQLTGYRISAAGAADFRYLYADELHVKSFIADLEQALAGGQIISKSVAKVAADFTIPAAGAAGTLVVEEFAGFIGHVFVDADIIRLRQFSRANNTTLDVADVWGTVVFVSRDATANPTTQSYTFTRSSAPNAGSGSGTIKTGTLALDYGTTGNGYYEVTAVDGVNGVNSPYAQFVTWTTHPATGLTCKTRIGNLAGITDTTLNPSGYGLYAQNAFLSGKIVASSGTIGGFTITATELYAGSGATRVEMQAAGGFWAGADTFAAAQFSVSPAGAMKSLGVVELGTNPVTDGVYMQNIAMIGGQIRENSRNDNYGTLYFNLYGFNGGATCYRNLIIGNGKGGSMLEANGALGTFKIGEVTGRSVDITINGTTTFNGSVTGVSAIFSYDTTFNGLATFNDDVTFNSTYINATNAYDINLSRRHNIAIGTTNIDCAVAEYDMTSMSITLTPKGNKIFVMFSAPFYTGSANQTLNLYINISGSNVRHTRAYIHEGTNVVSFHHIAGVSPGTSYTVKIRWSGTTSLHQYGSTDAERILTVIDLM